MNIMHKTLFASLLACSFTVGAGAQNPNVEQVLQFLDKRYDKTVDIAHALWEYAEVGYQEERSSRLLQKALIAEAFTVEKGVADIPTAFIASWGEGGPVIAILAEFDALPSFNQAAVPVQSPIAGKAAGHACGHNLFGAGSVSAAIAVKHWLANQGIKGTIRLYGAPAEEGGSAKVYMVRAGLFDDVDIALHWHPLDANGASAVSTLANRSAKFRFRGVAAHAAGSPESGRSALDGVEAFNYMVNMLREHIPQEARIHYVITNGGTAPNVVPDFAEVFYYVRHPQAEELKKIWARVESAARGAALGTGVEVDWEIIHGNYNLMINDALGRLLDAKLRMVGGVQYSPKEQAFAEQIYKSLSSPQRALGSETYVQPYESGGLIFGSTDVGDVSVTVPTGGFSTATFVPGTPLHSWQSTAAAGMSIGFKGAQLAAKVLSLAAIELFENTNLRNAARKEFEKRRGADFVYEPLLGNRVPPLSYRK